MRLLLSLIAFVISFGVAAGAAMALVWVLAGPHASLLPGWMARPVLLLGWTMVLCLPAWVTYRVWRRLGHPQPAGEPPGP